MYHRWLDGWDERRAQRGEVEKQIAEFVLAAEVAFPGQTASTIEDFIALADQALEDPDFFRLPESDQDFARDGEWLTFPSSTVTAVPENNTVWARVSESGALDRALVVFHHWNATSRQTLLSQYFPRRGVTVVEIAMPYHFERSRPGSFHADYMLSSNLGRTVQSVRQAVCDGRKLIRWLKAQGYGEISVLGMSLGSWIAGLVAAQEVVVSKASLFLTAGSLADMVWTGRATRAIRRSLDGKVDLPDLQRAWAPLNLERYVHKLARPGLDLQVVLARRDTVVLPELSHSFIQKLQAAGGRPDILELNCGHYSLARPPYIFFAGWKLKQLLTGRP